MPDRPATVPERPRRRWGPFVRHLGEMVLAMVAGMLLLGGLLRGILALVGVDYSMSAFPTISLVEMALTMVAGMVVWMRIRRHGWPEIVEMNGAMLVPAMLVVPAVAFGGLDVGTAMLLEHVLMIAAMTLVMLRRRDRYAPQRPARASRGRRHDSRAPRARRRALVVVAAVLAVGALPGAVFVASATSFERSRYAAPGALSATALATAVPPIHDPRKPTAVVLVGNRGANVTDALVPYELLAGTGEFNVYTVAPQRRPVPLLGGLDLVPDLDLVELRARLGGVAPIVTVVPEMPDVERGSTADDAPVTDWLRDGANRGLVLGVCSGARLLAEAGLLDGRPATSHWYRLSELERDHPAVDWRRGVRYVDAGDVVTTGGLLSAVDGTLRVVERLAGPDVAADAARRVGWPHYSPGLPRPLPAAEVDAGRALTHVLNLGFRSGWTTVGVPLIDGVGELDLAAAFGPWAEVKAARTLAVGDRGIRSRHGLTFAPRAGVGAAADVDLLLVPAGSGDGGSASGVAAGTGRPVERLDDAAGFAVGSTLAVMGRTLDRATARWAAVVLEFPPDDLAVTGPAWPRGPVVVLVFLGLLGLGCLGFVVGVATRIPPRRRSDQPAGDPVSR